MFTCIKSLNRFNLTHNNCIIFSIFLYFKYSFLLISFIYKFVHAYLQSCQKSTLNHFIKLSAVAYKRVAYKKIYYNQRRPPKLSFQQKRNILRRTKHFQEDIGNYYVKMSNGKSRCSTILQQGYRSQSSAKDWPT